MAAELRAKIKSLAQDPRKKADCYNLLGIYPPRSSFSFDIFKSILARVSMVRSRQVFGTEITGGPRLVFDVTGER